MTRNYDRRQALTALGAVSLGSLLAACESDDATKVGTTDGATATVEPTTTTDATTSELFDEAATCSVTPELTEGPYYFDADSIRSDIREKRPGTRLRLALRVREAGECKPIPDAVVDVWHCDALGAYSGFEGGPGSGRSGGERFLRGAQVTNAEGVAEFVTIYPGWYQGRTVHIHAKVHLDKTTVLTSQLFFDDAVSANVYEREPYAQHGTPEQANASDGIFDEALLLTLKADDDGWLGVMTFDVEAT
jgi:protocatechuate 3,4-dioxygenase beta subunit